MFIVINTEQKTANVLYCLRDNVHRKQNIIWDPYLHSYNTNVGEQFNKNKCKNKYKMHLGH